MRQIINPQRSFGEQDISQIALDTSSRDDIPRILRGLQYIYVTPHVRERVFSILAEVLPVGCDDDTKISADLGRPGMEQWKILVLGVLRLGLNADYDRVLELSNQHATVRQMPGHSDSADDYRYSLQTVKDNLRLFTPELLDRISQVVVDAGHALVKESPNEPLAVRIDSFVVETNVHFPTDTNLLLDAVRKVIDTCADHCEEQGLSDWRQSAYNQRCLKKAYRQVQRLKRSRSKDDEKRAEREGEIFAYQDYLDLAEGFLGRARETRDKLLISYRWPAILLERLEGWIGHAERQIDQIDRRAFDGERIPHDEKVFSIFQPHTE